VATLSDFAQAARPKTLPAALVPVAVGLAVAGSKGSINPLNSCLAFIVALSVQIGTNYANDYSDGIRGTDEARVGPTRLVASGLASPRSVKYAAYTSFAITALAGLIIALRTSPWLILVGALCILAGWLYTGGPKPYGYMALGEVFVFVFFGLVAVVGTAYAALDKLIPLSFLASIPVGLLAVDLLMINNIRDIEGDKKSSKNTLAVLLGDKNSRYLYIFILAAAFILAAVMAFYKPGVLDIFLALPLAVVPVKKVLAGASKGDLIAVLVDTGRLQLVFGLLMVIGILL
jgi:1,4-dihydroxy-2-naphthoate octaprenyltransferase